MNILVLNAGSSSEKMHLYNLPEDLPATPPDPLWAAEADWTKTPGRVQVETTVRGQKHTSDYAQDKRDDVLTHMISSLWEGETAVLSAPTEIALVGHRVVHGGSAYFRPAHLTPEVLDDLRALTPFAPLHQKLNLEGVAVIAQLLGKVQQMAVFDTAYHHDLPQVAQVYPGPYTWFEQGFRRYGFHGINHKYTARRSAQLLQRPLNELRIVTCHLGSGCSLAATRAGQSIDTTMGFTPLEGLMMGTRAGSIDPGLLLYLQRAQHLSPDDMENLLNHESGLKGISGLSGDMRTILQASKQDNQRARLALDLFNYRLRTSIGAMSAALEGIDVLTFTGGIGEHAPEMRLAVCRSLAFLGLALDADKNAAVAGDQDIATADSAVRVLVVQAREEWEIARSCHQSNEKSPDQEE